MSAAGYFLIVAAHHSTPYCTMTGCFASTSRISALPLRAPAHVRVLLQLHLCQRSGMQPAARDAGGEEDD